MSAKIDWLYRRKSCITCQRAQAYLDKNEITPKETTDAAKERRSPAEAIELARTMNKIVVMKGKKVVTFDMKKDAPDDETLLKHLIGPSGNLRAPTILKGKSMYVGFSEEAYADLG